MAKVRPIKTNFTNGEVDPLLTMRTDLELFVNGAAKMRNVIPFPQGGFRRRDGLEFMTAIPPGIQVKPIGVVNIAIDSGGTGYIVGDDLTLTGGTGPSAKLRVESTVSGVIAGIVLIDSGDYTVAPSSPAGHTGGTGTGATFAFDIQTQMVVLPADFTFAVDQNYLIIFTVSRFYIFRKEDTGSGINQLVEQGLHPYSSSELLEITWTQSLDVMLLFHQNHPIFQLTRTAEMTWTWDTFLINNPPSFAFGQKQTAPLSITQPTKVGQIITVTATSGAPFAATDVGNYIRVFSTLNITNEDRSSFFRITVFTSSTEVDAETLVLPLVTGPFTVNGVEWLLEEPEWSQARGYPRCGTFFQGRLCVAGSRDRPNTFWTSRTGDINDFNNGGTADDLGISITLDAGDAATIQNIYPGRHLQLFADSSEFYIPVSELEPITPTTASLRRTTSVGSVPGIPVFEVDGVVYFIQRGGESLRQFVFVDGEKAYSADIISLFSSHLIRNPRDAAFKKSLNTKDGNYIWIANKVDGSLAVFSILRSELINAWSLLTTKGDFHHVSVLDQTTYFHNRRTIDSNLVDYIEFFNPDLKFDAGVIATNLTSPVTVVTGLEHLEAETVKIFVDEILFASQTVVSGSITLPVEAQNSYQLGLDFPNIIDDDTGEDLGVNVLVETLPGDVLLAQGTTMGRKKRIATCTVRFRDTQGFYLQGIQVPFRNLPEVLDVPIPLQTGDKELKGLLGWNDFGQIQITQIEPLAMTVLGLAYDLSSK